MDYSELVAIALEVTRDFTDQPCCSMCVRNRNAAPDISRGVSMPVADIAARLAELPHDKAHVAYCRGPYCVYAVGALAVLRAQGRRAQRLTEGFPAWRLAGRPVRNAVARSQN
jgi:rhodanese-related sulfurtransferase